jgi:2,3-bisphosphoglycerate-independent phosphoglycerate mutase
MKILLLVLDGLGGLPVRDGKTELELAKTPNLDNLAKRSALGMHIPVDVGITPGSGPGHLALFGYDPMKYEIGRGILEAMGLGVEIKDTDIAVRGNYATVRYENGEPIVVDRRAGRIPTQESRELTLMLAEKIRKVGDAQVILAPGMEHRFAVVFRFPEPLSRGSDEVSDTDPQKEGLKPKRAEAKRPEARKVAEAINLFVKEAGEILKERERANYVLLRGVSQKPDIPTFKEKYGLKACCIAVYPMYRGLAGLVGMEIIKPDGPGIGDQLETLRRVWGEYDFFFVHIKKTDSYGEDGNYEGKVSVIEEFDRLLPQILSLSPDVLAITGDHSTPSVLKGHSWHPVPLLISSPYVLGGTSERFTERECLKGEIGIIPAVKIMNLLRANALLIPKFGA